MKKATMFVTVCVMLLLSSAACLVAQEAGGATVSEKNLVMMPCRYVGQSITTEGAFMDLSSTLLDDIYHDADTRFDSKTYLNFRTVENGMSHYFIKQESADILGTLRTGDRILISGKVKSCADKHPWVEVDSVTKVPPTN